MVQWPVVLEFTLRMILSALPTPFSGCSVQFDHQDIKVLKGVYWQGDASNGVAKHRSPRLLQLSGFVA